MRRGKRRTETRRRRRRRGEDLEGMAESVQELGHKRYTATKYI